MVNKLLNFRCPSHLLSAIDKIGKERYPADNENKCDRSKTLIDIIAAGIEALTDGEVVLPSPKAVTQSVRQVNDGEIKALVESLVAPITRQFQGDLSDLQSTVKSISQLLEQNQKYYCHKNALIPDKSISENIEGLSAKVRELEVTLANLPTKVRYDDLRRIVSENYLSTRTQIEKRDKSIALLAEHVAHLEARLDSISTGGISKDNLQAARDKVVKNWKEAKAPEKRERIGQAIDKVIDAVSNQPPVVQVNTDNQSTKIESEKSPKKQRGRTKKQAPVVDELENDDSTYQNWERICIDNIEELNERWYEK